MIGINLFLVFLLIAATAFFVATEFAVVKVRKSRIDQLVAEGNKNAVYVEKAINNLDEALSACQLGITITALGLGWLGEPTVEKLLHPLFHKLALQEPLSSILSFVIAFAAVTFLHVVIGELAPKTVAIQKAEEVTLLFARPLLLFYKIMFPFIKALNGSARVIVRLFGFHQASEHEVALSEEELRIILSESFEKGEINQSEYKYVNKIFEFDNRLAREIMVPRTEMVTVDLNESVRENMEIMRNERYTRYPVQAEDKDNIVGIINIKEVFHALYISKDVKMADMIRPVIKVIETIPIQDLLIRMQKDRIHLAILVDEYGGTAGLVTVEDIVEEIVGDIRDEFDTDEQPYIRKIADGHYIADGKILLEEMNDLLGTELEEEEVDTLGGWILTKKIDIQQGESISEGTLTFLVMEIEGHHIKLIEVKQSKSRRSPEVNSKDC
ncbi:HlyC/CorC family transporter [Metabacillus sp. KIGAM252]|uniref:HlyC/CorC family transporter n=1 Tax=Metabacillus flavus TaxID=2823519 RepID=A0ABS5LII0_9BACI|nr:hemolysin family protein [Metabacillus flavus]MBS2970293.1 HlyC/CorC family transporter [Metabacillus flavus]